MSSIIVVGGSGFIGTHLTTVLLSYESIAKIVVLDIAPPKIHHERIEYIYTDIRNKIELRLNDCNTIFHLAALCKEPGYEWEDYFVTNYIGTKNVCDFALTNGITNVLFTSTMMVFNPSKKKNSEEDLTAPDTAYGISKLLAEEVLINWHKSSPGHRLRIIRPGVVFGKGENGNYTRLVQALKYNLFAYIGTKRTIKGSIYVKDVVKFLLYLINDNHKRIIYNFVLSQPDTIESICKTICAVMGWKRFIPVIPFKFALLLSYVFELLNQIGVRNPVHHRRIEKLYYSTHLSTDAVLTTGFQYSFTLRSALEDWKKECNGRGLF